VVITVVVIYLLRRLWAVTVAGQFGGCSSCPSTDPVVLALSGWITSGVVLCAVTR